MKSAWPAVDVVLGSVILELGWCVFTLILTVGLGSSCNVRHSSLLAGGQGFPLALSCVLFFITASLQGEPAESTDTDASFAFRSNFIFLLSFQQSYCVTIHISINLMSFDGKEGLQRQPPQRSQPSATLVFCNSTLLTHCVPSLLIYRFLRNPNLKVTVIGGGTLERFSVMRRWTYKLS